MNHIISATIVALVLSVNFFSASASENKDTSTSLETVANDPLNAKIYTLKNGLTLFISEYDDEPRVQTLIAVKAGSKFDPSETTGLAHYLEHMLFKGTDKIGSLDWERESHLLKQIEELYEIHKNEEDVDEKTRIYHKIDSLSYEASKFVVPNEYDKMINSLGAKSTNAYTSNDRTVYMNDIPSNELEKWMMVESERFRKLVLRLFHTELETVYEEFNRSQDMDDRWSFRGVLEGLFPNHPYGTQSTIGLGEHLKNPSMKNIHEYFNTYYVPNNIAIVLSGDVDPDQALRLTEKYFGDWEMKAIPEFKNTKNISPSEPVISHHYGPEPEHVFIGFALDGANSRDALYLKLLDGIFSNSQAGLIDLNLVQQQKVLKAYSFPFIRKDYSAHFFYAAPKKGQTLEEVKDLLLEQIAIVNKGAFDDWMLNAVTRNYELNMIKSYESNFRRAHDFVETFTEGVEWNDKVSEIERMKQITKEDLVNFVNKHYSTNYAVAYKHTGQDTTRNKVIKPKITPVVVNRDDQSSFFVEFDKTSSTSLEPKFLDFENDISRTVLECTMPLNYVKNKYNQTFSLSYIYDVGELHDPELSLAIQYLPLLGTDRYAAEELQKEFYRLGLSFKVSSGDKKSYVTLSGLEESMEEGLKLFEHILANVKPDQSKYDEFVNDVIKKREDGKLNKRRILFNAMLSYAKYGKESPFTNIFGEEELRNMDVDELASKIKSMGGMEHRIFFYGSMEMGDVAELLNTYHKYETGSTMEMVEKKFPEREIERDEVYFVDYDMVQAEILLLSRDRIFDKKLLPYSSVFNEYFGSGLSSIIFQEIREQKALAYSAYSVFRAPQYWDESHYIYAYIGTQADKISLALSEMKKLMNEMPEVERQFWGAKESALKKLETDWITRSSVYWALEEAMDRRLDHDIRKENYETIKGMELADLREFFNKHIKGKQYAMCVIGSRENIDMEALSVYGEVKELTLEEIFNY